ncbi:MAG: hypothetical protein DELT_03345 [Desulfovibrio sp.]
MPGDQLFNQALMRKAVQAALPAVAYGSNAHKRKSFRRTRFEEALLQCITQFIRHRRHDEAVCRDHRAVRNQGRRLP